MVSITCLSLGAALDYSAPSGGNAGNSALNTPSPSPSSENTGQCSLPTVGVHAVSSDCDLLTTVELDGNLTVYGGGGIIHTIDRGGSGRHFTVGAGKTLIVERLRLHNGVVPTPVWCGNQNCRGGIVYVNGIGAALHLRQAWLSGGRAYQGGAIYASTSAQIYLNRTSVTSNSVSVSNMLSVLVPCFRLLLRCSALQILMSPFLSVYSSSA